MGFWWLAGVGFDFATGLMDGFRFYGFAGVGLWVWVCRHGFVVVVG